MKRGLSRGWFTVTTGDPERDRRGNTLLVALWLTMPAMVLTAAIFWNVPNGHLSGTVALLVGVASAVLVPVCRSGHVDIATYTYMAALLLLVVAQPVISGDLSTNALLVPPLAAFTMFLLPYDRRWLVVIWGVAAIAVLWVGTNDDDTVLAPRTTQLLTTALVSASTVIVIGLAAGELLAASRRQRELTRTLREQRGRLGEMERLANTDPLTGLFNRRALEPMSDRALPPGDGTGVALVDLDSFKDVNDLVSHSAGDSTLAAFARALQSSTRSTDVVFRVGGDEFLVVAEEGGVAGLTCCLERLQHHLKDIEWPHLPVDLAPTMSAGVVSGAGITLWDAIQEADALLHRAKAAGRDRIVSEGT